MSEWRSIYCLFLCLDGYWRILWLSPLQHAVALPRGERRTRIPCRRRNSWHCRWVKWWKRDRLVQKDSCQFVGIRTIVDASCRVCRRSIFFSFGDVDCAHVFLCVSAAPRRCKICCWTKTASLQRKVLCAHGVIHYSPRNAGVLWTYADPERTWLLTRRSNPETPIWRHVHCSCGQEKVFLWKGRYVLHLVCALSHQLLPTRSISLSKRLDGFAPLDLVREALRLVNFGQLNTSTQVPILR